MNTGQRLALLSGLSGVSAGAHLYAIRQSGVDAGQMLASRSSLLTATAMQHLLDDSGASPSSLPRFTGFHANMGAMMGRM